MSERIEIDVETLDRLTVAGLKRWRVLTDADAKNASHRGDRSANKLRTAAIDVLLEYAE